MIYGILNRLTNQVEQFDEALIPNAKEVAQQKVKEYTRAYADKEALRFHIARVQHTGTGEIWHNLSDSNPEEADYRVLDQYTGQYTAVPTLTEALALAEQRKQKFIEDLDDKVFELPPPTTEEKDIEAF